MLLAIAAAAFAVAYIPGVLTFLHLVGTGNGPRTLEAMGAQEQKSLLAAPDFQGAVDLILKDPIRSEGS